MGLTHIYVASAVGIALVISIMSCNQSILKSDKVDYNMLRYMLMIVGVSCFFDIVVFTADGHPNSLCRIANMIGNTVAYMATISLCLLWDIFVIFHLYGNTSKARKWSAVISIPAVILFLSAIINMFYPIVFTIDENNIYKRTPLSYAYVLISFCYILYSAYIHTTFKNKKHVRFFPIWVFLFPVFIGFIAQILFYGLATGWVGAAIGLSSAFMSIQKESAFIDSLTGLLNRAYLFSSRLYESMHGGMMLDINRFKSINDTFGHDTGDIALKEVANILSEATSEQGVAIRYAGDEFLIFVEKAENDILLQIKDKIIEELSKLNSQQGRKYQLSLSFGLGLYDPTSESFDEFVKRLDTNMYYDKEQYYRSHERLSRRKSERTGTNVFI